MLTAAVSGTKVVSVRVIAASRHVMSVPQASISSPISSRKLTVIRFPPCSIGLPTGSCTMYSQSAGMSSADLSFVRTTSLMAFSSVVASWLGVWPSEMIRLPSQDTPTPPGSG